MIEDNVSVIQQMYAAFGSGDLKAILSHVADDAEWTNYGPPTIPYAGAWKGQIPRFFEAIAGTTLGARVIAEDYIASGDRVVATGRFTATVKSTGAQIDTPVAHVFTLRAGKVTRWIGYSDSARVAEAHTRAGAAA